MTRIFYLFGKRLVYSKRNRNLRRGIIALGINVLMLATIVFAVEILLILLGVGDIVVPLTSATRSFLSALLF